MRSLAELPRSTPRRAPALAAALVLATTLAVGREARAQQIPDNHYTLDLFQGPVLAPIRVTGLAGSYAAVAEGIAGFVSNAASPAVREPFSVSGVEYDGSLSVSLPIKLFSENDDFDNSGTRGADYSNFIYATAGGILQIGDFGAGLSAELQRYTLSGLDGGSTSVTVGRYHALAAWAFAHHQLMIGAGARLTSLGVGAPSTTLTMFGAAPEVGFLWRPDWQPFRIGATYRAAVDGGKFFGQVALDPSGVARAGDLVVPDHVVLPWEIEVGAALQVGPRPLNPHWIDAGAQDDALHDAFEQKREALRARHADAWERRGEEKRALKALKEARRARFKNWPREALLLTASLVVSGATDRGVGIEAFLGQTGGSGLRGSPVGTFGATTSFSPRFGIETEPVPNLVHTRIGSYYEPSRFAKIGRQHFTFGADLRAFTTTFWGLVDEVTYKLQTSFDLSPRYQSFSLGVGVWH